MTGIISILLSQLLLCSAGALGCAFGKGKFEEYLPYSFAGVVLVELVFGIFGLLEIGFFAALLLCAAGLSAALFQTMKQKRFHDFAMRFFDGYFFCFLGLGILLAAVNYGKRMASWDEFSHWGDVVKVMTSQNILSTDPTSRSLYPEYPPAMALIQYFVQKVFFLLSGKKEMEEWLLYVTWQLFLFSLLFPFFRKKRLIQLSTWVMFAALFLLPTVFQEAVYAKIYIDAILSMLFGMSAAYLLSESGKENTALVCSLLFLLTLSKMLGFVFALAVVITAYLEQRKGRALLLLSVLLPGLIWGLNATVSGAWSGFSGQKMGTAASGMDAAWHWGILRDYFRALLTRPVTFSEAIAPGLSALLLSAALLAGLWAVLRKEHRRTWFGLFGFHLLFLLGLGVAFAWLYPAVEAEQLLGMERYLNNLLMAETLLLTILLYQKGTLLLSCVSLALILLFTPLRTTVRFLTRREVVYSQTLRAPSDVLKQEIFAAMEGKTGRILLIPNGDPDKDAFESMILRTDLRPNTVESGVPEDRSLTDAYDYAVFLHPDEEGRQIMTAEEFFGILKENEKGN